MKITNIGNQDNPIYLLGQKGNWALIEGGITAQFPTVLKNLELLVGNLGEIKSWFILHSHYDHCGLLSYLYPLLPEVQVFAGAQTSTNFLKEKSIQVIESLNNDVFKNSEIWENFQFWKKQPLNTIPITTIHPYDKWTLTATIEFHILPTPGHSDCSIALFETNSGTLFASDALGEYISMTNWFPLAFANINEYLSSIKTLEGTQPKTIALGHGQIITNTAVAFQNSLNCAHKLISEVQTILKNNDINYVAKNLHEQFVNNSKNFVPQELHFLSMKRFVSLVNQYN